jgi:hypothetical protein
VDADKLLHIDAVDYLLRSPQVKYAGDTGRLAGLNATYTGGFADDILERVPAVAAELINKGNPEAAQTLLKDLNNRHLTEYKSRNYGFDIEGHHPMSIGGSHVLASDMSMRNAQSVYEIGRLNGVEHGTDNKYMLPITRVAHDLAHTDPVTHKTNKSGFQIESQRFRQADPEARAMAALPMNLLEQSISKVAYNRPEEQTVRRYAAGLLGITPEQLTSFERDPNYLTDTGRPGDLSYVKSSKKRLGKEEMAAAILKGWGMNASMSDVLSPNQMKVEFQSAKRAPEYRDRQSAGMRVSDEMRMFRPEQEANVMRLVRGR